MQFFPYEGDLIFLKLRDMPYSRIPFFSERLKLQKVENTVVGMYFKTIYTFIGQGLPRTQHPFYARGKFLPSLM